MTIQKDFAVFLDGGLDLSFSVNHLPINKYQKATVRELLNRLDHIVYLEFVFNRHVQLGRDSLVCGQEYFHINLKSGHQVLAGLSLLNGESNSLV